MNVFQLNKKSYCDAGFIEGGVTLSWTPEDGLGLHWEKNAVRFSAAFI